jgi:rhomboid protease GluP
MSPDLPTQPPARRIPARSERQALDWSLVLASQGIEHVVERTDEAGWHLLVNASAFEAAQSLIRQYRLENRRWFWQRTIPQTGELFDWLASAWVMLTFVLFWLSDRDAAIQTAGMVDGQAVADGQWWRLFTATLLHADLAHLAANAGFGFLLLGLAMGRYGTGIGLLGSFLGGVCGNVVSWLLHGAALHSLGASGVVMAALGMVTVQSFSKARINLQTLRLLLGGLAAGVMLFVLLGVSPGSDVVAHLGGFAAGILGGLALYGRRSVAPGPLANLSAGVIFASLVIGTWWLALRHAG